MAKVTEDVIKTKKLSLKEIESILVSNEIEKLIGIEEAENFECREMSYLTSTGEQFDKERNKFNLVKDIVSIANSGGGIICIGVKTLEKTSEKTEYITEISPVPKEHIQMKSWEDILYGYTIPNFKRQWLEYGYSGNVDKIFWIKIADIKKTPEFPILVSLSKKYEEGLSPLKENFGLYFRDRSVNVPFSPEKLHTFIQQGFKDKGDIQERYFKSMLEIIDAKIDLISKRISKEDIEQIRLNLIKEGLENATKKMEKSKGFFYLYAFPTKGTTIKDFWDQDDKSVYHFIKNTPHLREMGWDLRVALTEYPYPNKNQWEITNGNRKLTSIDVGGRILSIGSIDGFLNWGVGDYVKDSVFNFINAFALVEYIDVFFHTLEVFKKNFDIESDYKIEVGFIETGENTKLLFPPHISGLFNSETETIKKNNWVMDIPIEENKHPSYYAGQLAQEIYVSGFSFLGRFGETTPYLLKDENGLKVNEELYLKQ